MTDIFISYSRKESDFGQRLYTKMTEAKRDVWMDWADIPPTVEWWKQIQDGILACNNFVLLISPYSIASPICNLEIAHAIALNKRIIPILYRVTDEAQAFAELFTVPLNDFQRALLQERDLLTIARDNWRVLAGLNWIDFADHEIFQERTQELLKVIDTNFEHVNEHTWLLVRATDWANRKRSPSLLVGGDELISAEAWLQESGTKEPQPTALQREYIRESRHTQNEEARRIKRLRQASALFGVMLVFALIAVGFAQVTMTRLQTTQATVEWQATYFSLNQGRAATLAAGGIILPAAEPTGVPVSFIATTTQVAALNSWQAIDQEIGGVEMVQVPPGCFWMGSIFAPEEQPIHQLCFDSPFWIDRYEVTNQQFEVLGGLTLVDNRPSDWPSPQEPRTSVTWSNAKDFCTLRQARLPTEPEWEYAARGPNSRMFPWGNEFDHGKLVYRSTIMVTRVGTVGSTDGYSWVGAYDMSGNIQEWVSTGYALYTPENFRTTLRTTAFFYPYNPTDGREDPDQPDLIHVLRGGSFVDDNVNELRAAYRGFGLPDEAGFDIGFRCVRDA